MVCRGMSKNQILYNLLTSGAFFAAVAGVKYKDYGGDGKEICQTVKRIKLK